jgi:hypothetical protein
MADSGIRAHQEWLGLIQPVGLVVAPNALVNAQVEIDQSLTSKWLAYDALLVDGEDDDRFLPEWPIFARDFLEWEPAQLAGGPSASRLPVELTVMLPELDARLEPTYAVPDPHRDGQWLLLIKVEDTAALGNAREVDGSSWTASPHDRFERLLRDSGVAAGLLVSPDTIRFVYAPRGESSGWLSFPVETMATPHGRPMLAALFELLKGWRLSRACPETRGLRRLLEDSRKYQNDVSTRLAEQVLGALYELGRGFQAADDATGGGVLQSPLREAPSEVYGGLLTTIMRLVFVLYAEERGMLPQDSAWVEHYGVGSLLERLRGDKARYPDTMDQRYGGWPRLLSLFRILHDGARHDSMVIPPRAGELFDPDRYPFLEGRPLHSRRVMGERLASVPRLSDGTLLRVLERLLVLDEERLSYRALDVEQIGSVYEAMMGFEVLAARGTSIAVRPKTKKQGSPSHPIVNLDKLLRVAGKDRAKWLKENADCELPAGDLTALRDASDVNGLLAALTKRISPYTPQAVHLGGLVLSPTEERRRSGSHYTPRELTEPIVETTLRPVLEAMGEAPTVAQLLELRICDPAMGSGAFLVGACRYLGSKLVEAWQREKSMPAIPPDEDPQLFARRVVAQRCLFGVDRNPFAVQLAKLSLWLVTLARDHPFTFLDHALRCGDSLVGLTRAQIASFHWNLGAQSTLWAPRVMDRVREAEERRRAIESLAETDDTTEKRRLLDEADDALRLVRLIGDAAIAAFFREEKPRLREAVRAEHEQVVVRSLDATLAGGPLEVIAEKMRAAEPPIVPFHWEIEFPEVFARTNAGFDAMVGNPPFAGKNTLINSNPEYYLDWLQTIHQGAHGNSDLVAHFFRRSFGLLRSGGAFGLIATNTIAQGDTRATGLRWIRKHRGTIYEARRRYKWPGAAAVVVSVVHAVRGAYEGLIELDGHKVDLITAFLFHSGGDDDPAQLPENDGKSFIGSYLLGMGFTFDDENEEATPIAEMHRLIAENPRNAEVIFPYIGGEEVNDSPSHAHRRYVINFGEMSEAEARAAWPKLMRIVEEKVRPQRLAQKDEYGREYWWRFLRTRPELRAATASLKQILTISRHTPNLHWARLSPEHVFAESLVVVAFDDVASLSVLQSRPHEIWARFFGSSMKDDLRYTPSECFEAFPRPSGDGETRALEAAGREYLEYRSQLMASTAVGLTRTYNRFNDRDESDPGILCLRELHDALDRAVLDAYGWTDIEPVCDFFPEHEEDEDDSGRGRRKWRYRWPDHIRDEVLARLLELNRHRSRQRASTQESLF